MIINPTKIARDSIPAPDEAKLKALINQTYEEVETLRLFIRDNRDKTETVYLNDFLSDVLITNSDILLSISKLSSVFLNSSLILSRTFLEIMIDFLWVYSIFLDNKQNGEDLAKRFYQMGARYFLSMADTFELVSKNDPFVKEAEGIIDIGRDSQKAKELNLIELIDRQAKKKLQELQSSDWRALPGFVKDKTQIQFRARSKKAADLACRIFNLKAAPYQHNWKSLNAFAHFSSLHYKYFDEKVADTLFARNLNIFLGFIHDMIFVCYKFIGKPVPRRLKVIQRQFVYFST